MCVRSSPTSDFESSSASPLNLPIAPSSPFVTSSIPFTMSPFVPDSVSSILHEEHFNGLPPPPYSLLPPVPTKELPAYAENLLDPPLEPRMLIPQQIDQEDSLNSFSIEEIVRMVITALKMRSSTPEVEKESPEEILRRKRQQNNLAAARYRKRQREARDLAEGELDQLLRRNENLRRTVERMQMEIAELKQAVLSGGRL
ncbi:hypothetical protein RB195_001563 [Necator americanus]|uniref:BZIP domain-containing protein n=1 Tax=Necator americanus TaxID=51031 RepID=A0ABR1DGG9_NECAM